VVVPHDLRTSPAADRNKQPILEILQSILPQNGQVLEIASGTGQHVVHFAAALPGIVWQPSDPDAESRRDVHERILLARLGNVHEPLALDVERDPWPAAGPFDGIVCINMIHVSPWSTTLALMRGAAKCLAERGLLVLYGPFKEGGEHTAESNAAFDASLRERDVSWGVRDLETVARVAAEHGLMQQDVFRMPANNLTVVFRKLKARGEQ
jgi:cyclopropane fatty-acyl-phospholipid synthase-like methyltransferase